MNAPVTSSIRPSLNISAAFTTITAANVYLGLKVGLTFATSIPAAVISMAVLRLIGNSNILENNIVQTIASAAGTLAAIIFVLPGLIMVGWWQGLPYWTTVAVCAIGGTLGGMLSVPLRRASVASLVIVGRTLAGVKRRVGFLPRLDSIHGTFSTNTAKSSPKSRI